MSSRSVSFLAYLAALRTRPDLYALYAAAQRGSLLAAHRFHAAVEADADLRGLRNAWIAEVKAEELAVAA